MRYNEKQLQNSNFHTHTTHAQNSVTIKMKTSLNTVDQGGQTDTELPDKLQLRSTETSRYDRPPTNRIYRPSTSRFIVLRRMKT